MSDDTVRAIAALYDLGDDSMMPQLIDLLKANEDAPDIPPLAYRALRKMTNADLPPTRRAPNPELGATRWTSGNSEAPATCRRCFVHSCTSRSAAQPG